MKIYMYICSDHTYITYGTNEVTRLNHRATMIQLAQISFRKTFWEWNSRIRVTNPKQSRRWPLLLLKGWPGEERREGSNHTSKVAVDDAYIKIDANKSILDLCIWPNGEETCELTEHWAHLRFPVIAVHVLLPAKAQPAGTYSNIMLY